MVEPSESTANSTILSPSISESVPAIYQSIASSSIVPIAILPTVSSVPSKSKTVISSSTVAKAVTDGFGFFGTDIPSGMLA